MTGVHSEVERQKGSDDDFDLPWRGNKNEVDKMWTGKAKACLSSRLQQKHIFWKEKK